MPGSNDFQPQPMPGAVRVIEQAKGILMAQHQCGPEEAFDLLRLASQRANVKIHVFAERLIEQVTNRPPPADLE